MNDASESKRATADKVERATLPELHDVHIDDVYVQMDYLLESRPTPLDLYYRWENQGWSTQKLDFTEDTAHWASMADGFEGVRTELQRSFTLFFVGEQTVTDTLSPLVHAAPDEPSRIFLSTQLVDEARHAVFFSRFFREVIGIEGGLHEALMQLKDRTVGAFKTVFEAELVEATERVRMDPHDYAAWVEGITIYHLVVEGMLALTGQKFLLGIVRELGILPAFYTGFTAVARDESRHVNFGVRALMEAGIREPDYLKLVEGTIFRLLEPACRIVAAPERKFAVSPEALPPNLQVNPYEVRTFSLNSLTKRLRTLGLSRETCAAVTKQGEQFYEAAWLDYEEIHGEEHPRRYYEREGSTTVPRGAPSHGAGLKPARSHRQT